MTILLLVTIEYLKKYYSNEEEHYLEEVAQIIETVGMKLRNRSQKAQIALYDFIKKTDYYSELKKDLIYGHSTIESLFYFASQFMEIKEYTANETIYHQGEIAEYVFLIILGKIAFKAFEYCTRSYTFEEYCSYLASIKDDTFLIQSIINYNENIYLIRKHSDVYMIPSLITKMEIIKYAAVNDIQSITSLYTKKNIDNTYMQFNEVLSNELSMDTYYDNLMLSFTEKDMYYSKLITPKRSELTILSYTSLSSDDKISCFGNFKLGDNNHILSETVIAVSPTILLLINKKLYTNCVLNDEKQSIEKEINHLHQFYFFKGMRRGLFSKYFFFEFNLEEYTLNHILYKENEPIDKLYIIKEGSVELSINNRSLFELKSIIAKLKALEKKHFSKEEYDDTIQLVNSLPSLMQSLQQKKSFVLFITSKTILGEWEFYYNTTAIYTARVTSEHAKIYSIPLVKLNNKDNEDIGALNRYLKEAAFGKLSGILKRIMMIKNAQFEKVDSEFSNSMKEEDQKQMIIEKSLQLLKDKDKSQADTKKSSSSNNNPLKYSYSILNTLPNTLSLSRKMNTKGHRKINSLYHTPKTILSYQEVKSKEKGRSLFHAKNQPSIESVPNQVPLSTKEGIVFIEKKRKERRKEQNKNTSATIEYTLPNIYIFSPKSRNMKNSLPTLPSFPKSNNDSQGLIKLELPIEASPLNKKTINYLTVQKYKKYSHRLMMDAIKIKYSSKGKNMLK